MNINVICIKISSIPKSEIRIHSDFRLPTFAFRLSKCPLITKKGAFERAPFYNSQWFEYTLHYPHLENPQLEQVRQPS